MTAGRRSLWWLLSACRTTPTPDEVWLLRLHGEPVGLERRIGNVRERVLVVEAGGEAHRSVSTTTVTGWDGLVNVPPATGTFAVAEGGATVPRQVLRDGDRVRWWTDGGPVVIELDAAGVVRWSWAGLTGERVAPDTAEPPPLDVARALRRPAPPFPNARRALVGVYDVGEATVRVDAPLRAELAPSPVERLVREVADEVADGVDPFGTGGGGFGDCTEHAAELVRRARAAGVPARPLFGFLVTDGALVPHAWVEVEVGGRWVAVDPALRQYPADAGHLPLGPTVDALARVDGVEVGVRELR